MSRHSKGICKGVLKSGYACTNVARYGAYCGIHRSRTTFAAAFGPSVQRQRERQIVEICRMPGDILSRIAGSLRHRDLIKMSKTCLFFQLFVVEYMQNNAEKMFLDDPKCMYRDTVKEAFFIMCGGCYTKYRKEKGAFFVRNMRIDVSLHRDRCFRLKICSACISPYSSQLPYLYPYPYWNIARLHEQAANEGDNEYIFNPYTRTAVYTDNGVVEAAGGIVAIHFEERRASNGSMARVIAPRFPFVPAGVWQEGPRSHTVTETIEGPQRADQLTEDRLHVSTEELISNSIANLERFFWTNVLAGRKCGHCNPGNISVPLFTERWSVQQQISFMEQWPTSMQGEGTE